MKSISEQDLQVPRSAAGFRSFVEGVLEQLGSTPEGKEQIRFRQGIAKPLVEEALPISLLCELYFKTDPLVTIQHVLGNQNFDAIIDDKRSDPAPFSYLEITQAHEGENEHLRMLALKRYGHVSVFGDVRKTGTKHTGITVEVNNQAKSHAEVLATELKRVKEAVYRKVGKAYPANTGLLIVFDDYIAIKDAADLAALKSVLLEGAQNLSEFRWIGAVGWSGKTLVEQKL